MRCSLLGLQILFTLEGYGTKDNGYAMVSATEDDLPVVEFSHRGSTHYERFAARLRGRTFRMVRFGPAYMTAEDDGGGAHGPDRGASLGVQGGPAPAP